MKKQKNTIKQIPGSDMLKYIYKDSPVPDKSQSKQTKSVAIGVRDIQPFCIHAITFPVCPIITILVEDIIAQQREYDGTYKTG